MTDSTIPKTPETWRERRSARRAARREAQHAEKIVRHERRLLSMRSVKRGSTPMNMRYEPTYTKNEDGSVFYAVGEYGLSAELWDSYVKGLRYPQSRHAFEGDSEPIFSGTDRQWPRRKAVCTRCGDERLMAWQIDPTTVRDGWCVK